MNHEKSFQKNFHKFNLTTAFRILLEHLRVVDASSGVLPASVSLAAGELPIATAFSFPDVCDAFELCFSGTGPLRLPSTVRVLLVLQFLLHQIRVSNTLWDSDSNTPWHSKEQFPFSNQSTKSADLFLWPSAPMRWSAWTPVVEPPTCTKYHRLPSAFKTTSGLHFTICNPNPLSGIRTRTGSFTP